VAVAQSHYRRRQLISIISDGCWRGCAGPARGGAGGRACRTHCRSILSSAYRAVAVMVLPRTCPAGIDVLRASLSGVECTPPVQAWYRAELEAGRTTSLSDIDRKPPPAVLPYRHLAEGKGSWVTGKNILSVINVQICSFFT